MLLVNCLQRSRITVSCVGFGTKLVKNQERLAFARIFRTGKSAAIAVIHCCQ